MGELGDFFGAIVNFFASFQIFFLLLVQIGDVFADFTNVVIALLIFIPLMILGTLLQLILAIILFVPMFLIMSILTFFLLCVIFLVYVLFTILSFVVALIDLLTLGHLNPLLRRVFTCSMVSDDWHSIPFQHMGNKYDRLSIAGLCYGCIRPCSGTTIPKKIHGNHIDCVARGKSLMKRYTPCAAVYAAYKNENAKVNVKDVEEFPFNHARYVNLADTIVKFIDFMRPGTIVPQLGQSICSNDADYCAAMYSISYVEAFMRTKKSNPFHAAYYALGFTLAFITVTGLYFNVRRGPALPAPLAGNQM